MTSPSNKLEQLGLSLPTVAKPVGAYVPAVKSGSMVYTSGQLPMRDGELVATGKVPTDVPLEAAQQAARQAGLNALAAAADQAGGIDNITRVVRMNCFVNSAAGFADQAKVANGASEIIHEILGPAGQHTRCALGAAELPLNAPVEIDIVVEVSGDRS